MYVVFAFVVAEIFFTILGAVIGFLFSKLIGGTVEDRIKKAVQGGWIGLLLGIYPAIRFAGNFFV